MKKICFSEQYGLQQSVMEWLKTHTRRVIPKSMTERIMKFQQEYYDATLDLLKGKELYNHYFFTEKIEKPPFEVGEIVAIAQKYQDIYNDECNPLQFPDGAGWNNKMYVKPGLMPHHIRILNVWIENLQDITDAGCIAEGIKKTENGYYEIGFMPDSPTFFNSRFAYAWLIDKISGKGTWDSNPLVFAYEFERID